jgi:hypothetical protein
MFLHTGKYSELKRFKRVFKDSVSTTDISYEMGKKIVINVIFIRIWKEAIVAYLKTLFRHLA